MSMEFSLISRESEYYPQVLQLRNRILRIPIGLNLFDEDLSDEENQFTVIMVKAEKVIGCILLKIINKETIKLRQMAIDEPYQRTGMGSLLIGYAENFCVLNDYFSVELNARKTAIDFYLKSGYHMVGDEFTEVGIPHVRMEKNLRIDRSSESND
ncbi:hypothetical protein EMGBS15_02990 [Filimonas sp.]|nr:hypothetical protein EMGBS15_02990 [Filimonas sp.]